MADGKKAAKSGCTFPALKTIVPAPVPVQQAIVAQLLTDAIICRDHSGVGWLPISKTGHQQQRRVHVPSSEFTRIGIEIRVVALSLNTVCNFLARASKQRL